LPESVNEIVQNAMIQQLAISTLALSTMMGFWYVLQRILQHDRTDARIDFLRGRWGCASCGDDAACHTGGGAGDSPGRRTQSPTP